jgi:8-oxo-dGTP diphosphatase
MSPSVQAAVKGLIVKDGNFLMLQQKSHGKVWWDLPGGRIKYGEDPIESLKREVFEETKLDVEVEKPIGVWYFFLPDEKIQIICLTYLCKFKSGEINLNKNPDNDEELIKYQWFTPQQFLKNSKEALLDDRLKKVIFDYFKI